MPFLRVIRDKRGYETTYLMHWYREGARQRSRILYVFRSPGGVRVGRESLAPDVLRDIEAQHPDIAFDWKAVFDNRQVVDTTPEMRRPRKRRRDEEAAPAIEPAAETPGKPQPPAPAHGPVSGAEGQAADGANHIQPRIGEIERHQSSTPQALDGLEDVRRAWPDFAFYCQTLSDIKRRTPRLSSFMSSCPIDDQDAHWAPITR